VARNTTRQGANFELKVMHDLEEHGYTCLRSSGSRGAVDVVAVVPLLGPRWLAEPSEKLLFIQCKITNPVIPPAERLAVQDLALRAGALPLVAFQETDRVTRRVFIKYRQLTGPGPKDWVHWAPGEDN
jgi:Holliday junction resolvase